MKTTDTHRDLFKALSDKIYSSLHQGESMTLQLAAEHQDYRDRLRALQHD